MKKISLLLPLLLAFVAPTMASAHQHAVYKIGNSYYQIVIGSKNEPVAVDDKTGLDLEVSKCATSACMPTMGEDGDMDGPVGPAVTGLETTLKLELSAGDQKKVLSISPVWGTEGVYSTPFSLTRATTYAYRLFGQISGVDVDLSFTCLPSGSPKAADNEKAVKLSDSVTQIHMGGSFGCPAAKEALTFPDSIPPVASINEAVSSASTSSSWSLTVGIVALALAAAAFVRGNKKQS